MSTQLEVQKNQHEFLLNKESLEIQNSRYKANELRTNIGFNR